MSKESSIPDQISGEVVTARCFNRLENASSVGKVRPMILVRREGSHWWAMGLTRKASYRDGRSRTPIPDPAPLGLTGHGFLWGRLTRISVLDVDAHVGWATDEVWELIERQIQVFPTRGRRRDRPSPEPRATEPIPPQIGEQH